MAAVDVVIGAKQHAIAVVDDVWLVGGVVVVVGAAPSVPSAFVAHTISATMIAEPSRTTATSATRGRNRTVAVPSSTISPHSESLITFSRASSESSAAMLGKTFARLVEADSAIRFLESVG